MIDRREHVNIHTNTHTHKHTNKHAHTNKKSYKHTQQTKNPPPHQNEQTYTNKQLYKHTNKHTRALDKTAALAKDSQDVYSADLGTDPPLGIESFFSVIYIRLFSFFSCLMSIILCIIISAVFYHIQDPNTLEYPFESSK